MAIRSFGSGLLFATPATGTPIQFGTLQDVSIDISRKTDKLFGQNQFPVAIGAGEATLTGKAKVGEISGPLYSELFFGNAGTVGTVKIAHNEAGAIPAATTFTVVVANATSFAADLGVKYAATGVPMSMISGAPATGEYSVSGGTYTFNAADASVNVLISYTWTDASNGFTYAMGNPLQGVQPVFSMIVERSYNGVGERLKFWSAISSKLTLPTAQAKFAISEIDFEFFADAAGNTVTSYMDE